MAKDSRVEAPRGATAGTADPTRYANAWSTRCSAATASKSRARNWWMDGRSIQTIQSTDCV